MYVTPDGARLFVETIGTGPPLLMLHGGLGFDHSYFRPDFDRLASIREVVYLDHRGNGRSDDFVEPITIESLAADAAGVIRSLGARAAVAGHSFGGFVAQELAVTYPDLVERLLLLSTTPGQLGNADDPNAYQGPPPPDDFLALLSTRPRSDEEYAAMGPKMLPFYMHGDAAPLIDRTAETIFRVRPMIAGFESLATWSAVDRLGDLDMPVLVIAGEHDVATSRQQSERIARLIPHAGLHVLADAGHFGWLEQPGEFFELVERFLL